MSLIKIGARVEINEINRVLSASMVANTPLAGYNGFGSPRVVVHPDTGELYLLFTAWSDPAGQAREIWVAPISKTMELDLSRAKKIATGAQAGVTGLNTIDPIFDDYNNEWLLFSTVYPTSATIEVTRTDPDFNLKTIDSITLDINPEDSGVSGIVFDNKTVLLNYGFDNTRRFAVINDITVRPIQTPTQTGPIPCTSFYATNGLDVHKLFTVNGRMFMLSEALTFSGIWNVRLFVGPDKDYNFVGTSNMLGMYLMPVSLVNPIPYSADYRVGNVGHPEYASVGSSAWLLWAAFPYWNLGGGRAWNHEIWGAIVPYDYFTDYKKWLPLAMSHNDNGRNIPFFTGGARQAVIFVNVTLASGATSSTITIRESDSPYHIVYNDGNEVDTHFNVTASGTYKFVIDGILQYMAISRDANSTINEFTVSLTD